MKLVLRFVFVCLLAVGFVIQLTPTPAPVEAAPLFIQPTELFISEYIEGSSNNKAIEIYNGTGSAVNLATGDYVLQMYFNGAVTSGLNISLTGTVADGDVYVVAHGSAAAAILAQADQTNSSGWFNGDDAIVLRKGGTTGTIVDVIGQVGVDPGTEWGTGLTSTADNTLRRKADVCMGDTDPSDVFDPAVEWDGFANDTFGGLGSHTANCFAPPVINEFVFNHAGADTHEFVEVFGAPSTNYATLSLLVIEGDSPGTGLVDRVYALDTTDINGYWVTGFLSDQLENGTQTLLLVENFSGAVNDDLDTNDDGVLDVTPWTQLIDSVAVNDGGATDRTYSPVVLTNGFDGIANVPGGASRIPNGVNTTSVSDWRRNDFDGEGLPTFGTGTTVYPEAYNTYGSVNNAPAPPQTNLVFDKDASEFNPNPSDTIDFYLSVENFGPNTATGVVVTDTLPSEVSYVSNDCSASYSAPTLTWAVGTMTNGQVRACTVTVTITAPDGTIFDNTASVTLNEVDSNPADNTDTVTITVGEAPICGVTTTAIYAVQGNGASSPLVGNAVTIHGVVTGDFQGASPNLGGFFVQEEVGDGLPETSDGIFVFHSATAVSVGDLVCVTGTVIEFNGLTEISPATLVQVVGTAALPAPVDISLPVASMDDFEAYEGMLVRFPGTLTVNEVYNLGRFGEVLLAPSRRYQPTNVTTPGAAANALQDLNDRSAILLDDASSQQNPDPVPYLGLDNTLRVGDTTTNLTGNLTYSFDTYRIQPTQAVNFTRSNPRSATPAAVGGSLKVTSFNVLNFFNGNGEGGGFPTPRGANTQLEFDRQIAKLVDALLDIDADVYGLMEMENDLDDPTNPALEELVNAMNAIAGAGTFAYIDTDKLGTDVITVAIIYKTTTVSPTGAFAALDYGDYRPTVAQTFTQISNGEVFTVVVNHLKSKSSCPGSGPDTDQGDGQGCWNATRVAQANALVAWLLTDPTDSNDTDFLIIGDLNSYAKEDPINVILAAGYINLVERFGGAGAYSYVFNGQSGYLDHALASPSLNFQVTGVTEWHINADEPRILDYNTEFNPPSLYQPDQFRTSDHDPVIIGLNLQGPTVTFNTVAMYGCASYRPRVDYQLNNLPPGNYRYVTGVFMPSQGGHIMWREWGATVVTGGSATMRAYTWEVFDTTLIPGISYTAVPWATFGGSIPPNQSLTAFFQVWSSDYGLMVAGDEVIIPNCAAP